MSEAAQLVMRDEPDKVATLHRGRPTTIGRAESNRLRLASRAGVADHHAVVRFSVSQGWLVCDWQSHGTTFLEGERIRQCRRLRDGDEIQLGEEGPVLVFRLVAVSTAVAPPAAPPSGPGPVPAGPPASRPTPGTGPAAAPVSGPRTPAGGPPRPRAAKGAAGSGGAGSTIRVGGRTIPLEQIRSAHLRSRQRYPNSFSWWVLLCLGGMVLLPVPWLFWGLEIGALAAWILLGSRKEHELLITLRDGMAHRYVFANRITALSHRNGIRRAIGQSLEAA
ncbi:MAG: FHA domain-containing protein [Cyanobium sp.]